MSANNGPLGPRSGAENNQVHTILDEFHFRIMAAVDQLKGGVEPRKVENFDRIAYWKQFDDLMLCLHKELTMIGVVFTAKNEADVDSVESLTSRLSGCILQLVSLRYGLPKDQGDLLASVCNSFFLELFTELLSFTDLLMSGGGERIGPQVGRIWNLCEQSKTTPRTNAECLSVRIREQVSLVDDALSELSEAQECDDDGDSDVDIVEAQAGLPILQAGIGMVKTAKALLTRVYKSVQKCGRVDTESERREFDAMYTLTQVTSSQVDDFALTLYPPPNKQEVNTQLGELIQHLRAILDLYKRSHYLPENEDKSLDVIEKAAEHNEDKVKRLVT